MRTKVICVHENTGQLVTEGESRYSVGNIYYAEDDSDAHYDIYTSDNPIQTRNTEGSSCDINSIPDIATRLADEIVEKVK